MFWANVFAAIINLYVLISLYYVDARVELFVPTFGILYFLAINFLLKNRKVSTKLMFVISTLILVSEVCYFTFLLGWDSGFYFFLFLLPATFFLNSNWKLWITIAYNLIIVDVVLSLWLVLHGKSSHLAVIPEYTSFLNIINVLCTAVVTIIVIIFFRRNADNKDSKLNAKNEELLLQNEEISKQHAHQEILLKEIHHRVKNNLQVISSLISLQTHTVKDDSALLVLTESKRRIEAIALIHQKLYQDQRVNRVDFKSYLEDLLSSQARELSSLKTKLICANNIELDLDFALPIGLILSELISNSIKHAYDDVDIPTITIEVSSAAPNFHILIKDNGTGLPDDFSFEQTDSLGMEIIDALIGQINGEIHASNDGGACFRIKFKNQ